MYKNKEARVAYDKAYNQANKEKKAAYNKIYRQANKEKIRVYDRAYRRVCNAKLARQVLEHYSKGTPRCAYCGETDPIVLQIDHIDGGGNKHRKTLGNVHLYSWLKKQGYPEGFQVLCANCNIRKYRLTQGAV